MSTTPLSGRRPRKARSGYVRGSRIFWREQPPHFTRRYSGDFREYADVGGRQEALIAPETARATDDLETARALYESRVAHYRAARRRGAQGEPEPASLATFATAHLIAKRKAGKVTADWLELEELHLKRAVEEFGDVELSRITTADVRRWAEHLGEQFSGGTARHHLNSLSNLYKRARAERVVPTGYSPVADLSEKPSAQRLEARWLEVPDAALLLEAARTYVPKRGDIGMPFAYPLVAAFLLTGGRRLEVLGLEVGDVSFDRRTITFRANTWRRLKTATSFRSVPLHPQLDEILRPYVFGARPPGRLLFPSYRTGTETVLTDFRKLLDAVAVRAGWQPGEITPKMFRHTYCAARLQTLDHGAPVSVYTVAKELGHGGDSLVKRVYGHLGQVRHRAEVVEYRVEQHTAVLGDRLGFLKLPAELREVNA